jgi:hypothetical protein
VTLWLCAEVFKWQDCQGYRLRGFRLRAGQGIWQYTGHPSYTAKSIAIINFNILTPNPPKVPPFKMGTQTIAQTIPCKDNPDEWSSTATVQFADSSAASYSPSATPSCVTALAQRFE